MAKHNYVALENRYISKDWWLNIGFKSLERNIGKCQSSPILVYTVQSRCKGGG